MPIYGPEYVALPRSEEPSIVKDLIPVGGLANLYGTPKAGKSYASLQLALAVSGRLPDWFGIPVVTHGPVWYIQLDTGRSWWLSKYVDPAIDAGYDLREVIFDDMQTVPFPFNILGEGGPWLRTAMESLVPRPILVIVDNIRDAHSGDENDAGVMRNVISTFRACTLGAAVMFLSHSRKPSVDVPMDLLQDARGSSAIPGMMDGIMKVWSRVDGSAGKFYYQSRAIPQRDVELVRLPNGFWEGGKADDNTRLLAILPKLDGNKNAVEQARDAILELGMWQGEVLNPDRPDHVDRIRKAIARRKRP